MRCSNISAYLDAAAITESDVEHRHVGRTRFYRSKGTFGRPVFANNLNICFGIQDIGNPASHDLVIVEKEDAYGATHV